MPGKKAGSSEAAKSRSIHDAPGILVTGGAGFIGSHLVDALLSWFPTARVTVVDAFTYAANAENLVNARRSGRLRLVRASVEDRALLRDLITPEMLVLHLAAESHVPRSFADPDLFDRVNRHGTRVLLEAARSVGVPRVIHFSTDEVYGSRLSPADETSPFAPTSPYARSKADAEGEIRNARNAGLDVTVLRPSNVIGPRQHKEKLIPRFIELAQSGRAFQLEGDGDQRRTFLAISDLVQAVRLIVQKGAPNATYNVAGAETFSVREVARIIASAMEKTCRFEHVADRPANDRAYLLDGAKMAALGFQPRTGVQEVVREIMTGDRGAHAALPGRERRMSIAAA
ncbi:GDP-mannose 4,6-dehydratase [Nitratireductor sp. L1-7-SE]|uniref:GDP-mannose 4,6-dehydratase n=1 Tax=Nitratireductor rhodophyticola TaxID=2854036 RepID=A0ABS7R8T6_9HYPH|nr:GDP-mannose 4,6-dehydratase [Nitratireductor rhodophyticola]MBY8917343.1 GDP-mannose 4,6-dehydratase [Nitratireductor rhodophyticola]MBY8920228.1 GDP-mannose 4,6-dehydratase [Nitratireductor rhodophyticola]